MSNNKLIKVISIGFAELFGTAILVFVSCLGSSKWIAGGELPLFHSCIAAGLSLMIVIHSFGHISGGHANPVTTIGAFIMHQIPLLMVPIYILAQLVGGVVGYGLLLVVTPEIFRFPPEELGRNNNTHAVGVHAPSPDIEPEQALAVEFFITLILTFANCSSWDHRAKHLTDSVSIRFGLTVAALNLAAASYSGGSMNPARSFAPAIWNNDWHLHWIYWVGPITSAIFGSLVYKIIFLNEKSENEFEID